MTSSAARSRSGDVRRTRPGPCRRSRGSSRRRSGRRAARRGSSGSARGVGEVGGRVEHDRRVLGGEVHRCAPLAALDRRHDRVEVLVLREAGDRARPSSSVGDLGLRHRRRQADDARRRRSREHGPRRLGAVQARHAVVHQHDVGLELDAERGRLVSGRDVADDLDLVAEPEEQLAASRGRCRCPRRARRGSGPPPSSSESGSTLVIRPRAGADSAAGRPGGRRARARDARGEPGEQRLERGRLLAGQQREHARGSASSRARARRARPRRTSRRPRPARRRRARATCPCAPTTPFSSTSRDATVTAPVATASTASLHLGGVLLGVRERVERDERSEPGLAADASARRAPSSTRASAACSALISTLPLFGSRTTCGRRHRLDRGEQVGRRRVHRAAAVDDDCAEALEELAVAVPGRHGDDGARVGSSGRLGNGMQQALLALERLLVHVGDLDCRRSSLARPRATALGPGRRCARAPSARWGRRRRAASRRAARARARDRLRRDRRPRRRRPCSSGSARAPGGSRRARTSTGSCSGTSGSGSPLSAAAIPRTISTSPAAPASTTPASVSTGSISRVFTTIASPAATMLARSGVLLRGLGHLADRGQHRPLDRLLHGAIRGVARRAKRARKVVVHGERLGGAANDLREDHARIAPCSHQRSARHLSGEAGAVVGAVAVERPCDLAHRERQVGPGVSVRDRIDVEIVDPAAVRLDRRARAVHELADEGPHALCLTRWMMTSTDATSSPVSRSMS